MTKILNLEDLPNHKKFKNKGKKIVQCHGVFDLLHLVISNILKMQKTLVIF